MHFTQAHETLNAAASSDIVLCLRATLTRALDDMWTLGETYRFATLFKDARRLGIVARFQERMVSSLESHWEKIIARADETRNEAVRSAARDVVGMMRERTEAAAGHAESPCSPQCQEPSSRARS